MSKPTLYIDSRLHIPVTHVDAASITKRLTKHEFDDAICRNCEFRPERPSSECRSCSAGGLVSITCLASSSIKNDEKHIAIPYGELHRFEKITDTVLNRFKIKDETNKSKFREAVEFTAELRKYQVPAVEDLIVERSGLLQSAPRTGKCVGGESVVDTSFGQVSMERLWQEFGIEGQESVQLLDPILVQTPAGQEPVSWIHRKKSKLIGVTTHFGQTLRGTPEHPVQVLTPDLEIVWRRMDELTIDDWLVAKPNANTARPAVELDQLHGLDMVQPMAVNTDVAYLVGHWLAAKGVSKVTNIPRTRDPDSTGTTDYSIHMWNVFGLLSKPVELTPHGNHYVLDYNADDLQAFMSANGFDIGNEEASIPEFILKSDPKIHRAFLTGYVEASDSAGLRPSNSKLFNELACMFLSLGVVTRQYANDSRIYLTRNQYLTFKRPEGNWEEAKQDCDIIPFIGTPCESPYICNAVHRSNLAPSDRDSEAIARFKEQAKDLLFHKIHELKLHDEEWVYDLTVEGSHSFLANGFAVHNTVMFVAASVLSGYRTCIIADQKDFLDGFLETIESMTNLLELEEETGRKLFGFPKTIKDYDNYEIALVTYQSLTQDSKTSRERLEAVNRNYGTVLVDEAHRANALVFSKLLNNIRAKFRWACTATPKRKDGKDYVLRSILGPIVASTDAKSLNATLCVHKTHKRVVSKNKYTGKAGWVRFCQFLAKHPERNEKIIKWLIRDIDRGRSIALPVMFTDHAKLIVDAINEHYEDEVAVCFLGGTQQAKLRKGIVNRARAGEIKLVVGTRRLIQVGINIPQWDTLYYIMPMNNEPNWYQESCRILTPLDDKKTPIIRLFLDERMDRAVQCFRQVLKFSEKLGYKKAPKTPRKLRNWIGVVSKDDVFSAEMPDYFEQGPTKGARTPRQGRQL